MTACFFEPRRSDKASPFDEWSNVSLQTPIVWDQLSDTLLHVDTNDDADHEPENIVLNMNMMSRYPRAKLSAGFQDSHVYVCRRSILSILQEKPRFESIREEFLPWLCTPQYNLSRRERFGHILDHRGSGMSQHSALAHSTLHTLKSGLNESSDDEHDAADDPVSSLRVGVVIHRAQEGITFRANTLPAYLDANHHFLSQTTYSLPSDPASRSLIDPKAQIGSDSMVGHTTKVGERTSIKRSVVGKHCVIGKYVRISGCVILDHCIIADGAKIDSCILGASTKIGSKAELSRCVTQSGYEVTAGESYKNERLEISDWTAASQSEAEESDTGSDATDDDD
ncbi:hypothetical protein NLI96_g10872 [Meripilus lineatus]|uniref:EIF2B subunit epsilon/gamma LbH domain-containing protein n=1 Tax=Meripilus lineatus TaxID=2056292 RepID=A0AAD5UXR9_9APHY|nr:hypothetical protein NLI96_g10872 [Physisporinus lineatus]